MLKGNDTMGYKQNGRKKNGNKRERKKEIRDNGQWMRKKKMNYYINRNYMRM